MSHDHSVLVDTKNQALSRLASARALTAAGCYVFPTRPGSKKPPRGMTFKSLASRDDAQLAKWFGDGTANIAIYTGRFFNTKTQRDDGALLVADVDTKKGEHVQKTIDALIAAGQLPKTRTHKTASGGQHILYRVPAAVKQGVNVLANGIDIRSKGGYIVAPGSATEIGAYAVMDDIEIAPAPAWLVEKCGVARERETVDDNHRWNDSDANTARAVEWLKMRAPVSIKGQGGDHTAIVMFAGLRDLNIGEGHAVDLACDHWVYRCSPPEWTYEKLQIKAQNAYLYASNPPGIRDPRNDFEPVEPVEPAPKDEAPAAPGPPAKPKLFFELFADIKPDLARPELVENLLDHGAMTVMYGDSNTGKTFLALDLAFAIATGRPWHGRDTEQGMAAYVAAEGGGHVKKRIEALRVHHQLNAGAVPLALIPCPVNLSGDGADPDIGVKPLIALIHAAEAATGQPCAFLIIDTLSRALAGANENAGEDMGAFIKNVDRIRGATSAHTLIVHHSGKDSSKGARGHSSLRAATDVELEVADKVMTNSKQRDKALDAPLPFDLLQVPIGVDAKLRSITSCVVVGRTAEGRQMPEPGKPPAYALATLEFIAELRGDELSAVPVDLWREHYQHRHCEGMDKAARSVAFKRARDALVKDGHVKIENGNARVAIF